MKKININDITLKSLSNKQGISLLFREKTSIAGCADSLGADAIELAPIKSVREDTIIYKTIAQNVTNSVLAIPVGFTEADVKVAWEAVKDAKSPRLQVEVPTSTVQMEYMHHLKAEKMAVKAVSLIQEAKKYCQDVEFVAVDATRAEEDFLVSLAKEVEANGGGIITLCDTAGISLPEEVASLVSKVKAVVSIPVYVQVSNNLKMSVATALAAIRAGADGLKCAMVGDDVLLAGDISNAIASRGDAVDAQIALNHTRIHSNINDLLSNINHDSYDTEQTVSDKKKILLDADSSISQIAQAAAVLGYDLSDDDCGKVSKALAQVCEKKGSVGAKELEAVIASSAMQAPSTYHLDSYSTTCGNLTSSMSQVTLKRGDELLCGVSTGDGPIDSVFRAIEQCVGFHYELDDFQIQAVTEGKEALGSAIVRLRNKGKLYSGNGTSTDIVAASIRAYINALNKIVFEEE